MRLVSALLLASSVCFGQNLDELLTAGVAALERGKAQEAYDALSQFVARRPGDARARIGLAEASRRLGKTGDAEEQLAAAEKMAPEQPALFRGLSIYYENGGEPDKAAHYEAAYVRAFPDDFSGFGRAAVLYLEAGDGRRAAEFARSGLERRASAPLQGVLGKALSLTGDAAGAQEALEEAVRLAPYDEEYRYDLGDLHLRARRFEQAAEAFEEARKFFDKSARIEIGLGVARYGQRRFDEAVAAFLRAAELAPAAPQPHYFLGRTLEHATDRIDDVLARQKRFAELQPDNYLGPFLHAQALIASLPSQGAQEQVDQAEKLLRRSIELRDDYWESHFELGALLDRTRRYEEAASSLERAIELNDASSKPHYRLARVYARLGRREDAARERKLHRERTEAERAAMAGGLALGEPSLE